MKKIFITLIIWIILIFLIIQLYPSNKKNPSDNIPENKKNWSASRSYFMGFNVNWQNDINLYQEEFKEAAKYSDIMMSVYNPSWEKLKNPTNSFYESSNIERIIFEQNFIKENNKKSLLAFNIFESKNKDQLINLPVNYKQGSSLDTPIIYNNLLEEIIFFTQAYEPDFFALGVEINLTYEKNPSIFRSYLNLYSDAFKEIKKINPNIKIFPIFQYEELLGIMPDSPRHTPRWEMVNMFSKQIDLFAISSTPSNLSVTDRDVPANYYNQLTNITTRPIMFTGISFSGSQSRIEETPTISEQNRFIKTFFSDIKNLNCEAVIWIQLNDFIDSNNGILYEYGLRDKNKKQKEAFNEWIKNLNNKKITKK
ncbi:MAG: hypothetical protein CL872_04580 [Dehalococcoidaceae bacterium]|nr:hypothetical protein [Dehalococcoidaceae bacterium]